MVALIAVFACGPAAPVPTRAPALAAAPPLPADVWFQLFVRDDGLTYRIADDGRWLVTLPGRPEAQEAPLSRDERGARVLSTGAMDRIRRAADEVGFGSLEPVVPGGLPPGTRPVNGGAYTESRLVFTLRLGERVASVEVAGDARASASLGPLGPLYTQVDREAIGGWMGE